MAAIPENRFEKPLQAFSKTGLDFAGPFSIKQGRAKQQLKSYILVFTCLQTQAVHLEATHCGYNIFPLSSDLLLHVIPTWQTCKNVF